MKNKYLLLLSVLCLASCTVDEQEEDKPIEVKFPFEELDKTYFNQTSNNLQAPTENLRLDSIVDYVYFRYDPNTGISNYYGNKTNSSLESPPRPQPTGRTAQVFTYNQNNKVERIDFFDNSDSDELTKKGTFEWASHFIYDANNNLIKRGSSSAGSVVYLEEYLYDPTNKVVRKIGLEKNSTDSDFVYQSSGLQIKNSTSGQLSSTETYKLDTFNNIVDVSRVWVNYDTKYNITYKFPKNIYHPYVNLFPKNFPPVLYFSEGNSGYTHFSSGTSDKFHSKIQLNSNFYPEIVESGSYDEGYRTKYYYSKIN